MATPAPYAKPLPKLEPDVRPYWDYLKAHRMHVQRCASCERFYFPPSDYCPRCLSTDVAWTPVSGRGTVYTFTIVAKPTQPFFVDRAPYVYALVELDTGVRLPTAIVDCDPERLRIGARVHAVFEKVDDEVTLLYFAPE